MHIPQLLSIMLKVGRFYRRFSIRTGYYEHYKQYLVNVTNNKKLVTFTGNYA